LSKDSQGLSDLISKVSEKVNAIENPSVRSLLDSTSTCLRMITANATGQYRDIYTKSVSLIVVSLFYLLLLLDGIADCIPGVGYTADTALLYGNKKLCREA